MSRVFLTESFLPDDSDDDQDDICVALCVYTALYMSLAAQELLLDPHDADEEDAEVQRDSLACLSCWTSKLQSWTETSWVFYFQFNTASSIIIYLQPVFYLIRDFSKVSLFGIYTPETKICLQGASHTPLDYPLASRQLSLLLQTSCFVSMSVTTIRRPLFLPHAFSPSQSFNDKRKKSFIFSRKFLSLQEQGAEWAGNQWSWT